MGWSCAISNVSRFSHASTNPLRGRGDRKNRFGPGGRERNSSCSDRWGRSTMPDRARMEITILTLSIPY